MPAKAARVSKIAYGTVVAWAIRAFTPVFEGLWGARDFAHPDEPSSAPSPTHLTGSPAFAGDDEERPTIQPKVIAL
jgi:hypothetical protein